MKQGIHTKAGLSTQELDEVRELWHICNDYEHINIKLNWGTLSSRPAGVTNDFLYYENDRLIGFLAIYCFLSTEVEISGMVHPEARRQGIFNRLVQTAKAECRRRTVPKLIFINERGSASGKAFLTNLGARYSFSEYVMELQEQEAGILPVSGDEVRLRPAVRDDLELLVKLNTSGFAMPEEDAREYVIQTLDGEKERTWIAELGEDRLPVGKIGAMIEADNRGLIYGFCISPEYRGQGIGRTVLQQTVIDLKERYQVHQIKLEVAVENEKALGLYQSCGFRTQNANDYYELLIV
ncbi:GNAT family N-acetyltransferase [Paenibacillus sedimenti]|uniref:GNAT family N-acetyltransferase n=1 Tax=Paenibacillus sedimenti TaxID=2770274 RepID=UPI001CB6E552|nr:GNAT family N-acetyltransferase [Paenibacillus sedimenti]